MDERTVNDIAANAMNRPSVYVPALVDEITRLRAELAECRDALAKIGPYYVPSIELSDDEVNAMYAMIDAARKGEGEK